MELLILLIVAAVPMAWMLGMVILTMAICSFSNGTGLDHSQL